MARKTQDDLTVRARVERAHGSPISDQAWSWLVAKEHISDYVDGLIDVEDVVDELRDMYVAASDRGPSPRVTTAADEDPALIFRSLNERMTVVAEFVARRAARDGRVERFRQRRLADTMLHAHEIDDWIDARYWAELPGSWPSAQGPKDATNFVGGLIELPPGRMELQWLPPDAETLKVWGVPPRTSLGQLAELSRKLSERWDWHPAHATAFILTGATPPRPAIRHVSTKPTTGWDDRFGSYSYLGIRLTVDAEVTPEQLAAWWRLMRRDMGTAGKRPIRDRAVRLASFSLDRPPDTTWREDMQAWNERSEPSDAFNDPRNFRRAVMKAWTAINSPTPQRLD